MADVPLTKVEGYYVGTTGASNAQAVTDPSIASYTAGAISDLDTSSITGWYGPLPLTVRVKAVLPGEEVSAEFALASAILTITYQGASTVSNVLIQR